MTSRDFCYWLQGYFELSAKRNEPGLSAEQAKCIADHLALVFVHEIDPSAGGTVEQAKLNAVHEGVTKEQVDAAIAEALAKLPRPTAHGTLGPMEELKARC